MQQSTNNWCSHLSHTVGHRVILLIIMLSIVGGFTARGRLFNKFGRFQSLYASSQALSASSHPSYKKIEDFQIKEYGLSGSIYSHKKSGAQVISVIAPDDNKVFGITFRTPPKDSTGVPHILEHSVLCGSRKYPVKEPFAELLRGSLQNFLNAFTYPDRTCYPVASTNTKDFYNLVNVYLDAVLHPRAVHDPQVLQQEGWHYELETPADPLTIKGVVFNEMKGVYSSPEALLDRATQQALFPQNTYGVDSGGDPEVIPSLTFENFKAFHQTYYHPSNSRIFFYGDDDPYTRLALLDSYLQDFEALPAQTIATSQIAYQKKLPAPIPKIKLPFPITPGNEPKHMITVNWLVNDAPLTPKELLAMGLLDYLLLGTPTSELRKVLTESNLGEKVIGGGLSDELLQATFSIGLKGVKAENVERVEQLVYETLEKISREGFPEDAIEAAVNTFEFRLREFNTGSYPKGLSVMLAMTKPWIYDRSPVEGITFEEPLAQLKEDLKKKKPIFQDLLQSYLLKNHHRVTVEMIPDSTLETKQQQEEANKLAAIKSTLSEEQIQRIIENTQSLREAQEREDSPEAKATLPRLTLQDIDPQVKVFPNEVQQDASKGGVPGDVTILTHDLPSAGILYTDLLLDYSTIDLEDVELLPLFVRLLMESGTKSYDETKLSRMIGAHTGGISISTYSDYENHHPGKVANLDEANFYLVMRGKATKEKIPILFDLMTEILTTAKLETAQKKAIEILRENKATKESRVISAGHSYAATRLAARDSILGYIGEVSGGVTSVREAGKLLAQAEQQWPELLQRLERIRQRILTAGHRKGKAGNGHHARVINLTAEKEILQTAQSSVKKFIDHLPVPTTTTSTRTLSEQWKDRKQQLLLPHRNEGFSVPSLVNYVVFGGTIFQPGETVSGSSSVISRFLSNVYLWDQVRVVGGAYGGFAQFSDTTGRFVYLSYRDPNLLNTIEVYKNSIQFLSETELSSEELLQSIIGTIGDLDSPESVDQKGYIAMMRYLSGETTEFRQQWRDEILATKAEDFQVFANRLAKLRETGEIVVFGSQQALETANQSLSEKEKLVIEPAILPTTASSSK